MSETLTVDEMHQACKALGIASTTARNLRTANTQSGFLLSVLAKAHIEIAIEWSGRIWTAYPYNDKTRRSASPYLVRALSMCIQSNADILRPQSGDGPPPTPKFTEPVCRGSIQLGNACKKCQRCRLQMGQLEVAPDGSLVKPGQMLDKEKSE